MRFSIDQIWPAFGRTKGSRSSCSDDAPFRSEGGLDLRTGTLQSPPPLAESASPAMSKRSRHKKAGRSGDGNRASIAMPPSTPRRFSARDTTRESETELPTADMASRDDPFEEFDVESGSEKEFLIANLKNDAPKDAVEQFRRASESWSGLYSSNVRQRDTATKRTGLGESVQTAWVSDTGLRGSDGRVFESFRGSTSAERDARNYELILREQDENGQKPLPSLEYPAPYLILQRKVEQFAQAHMFTVNEHVKPTTLQRREFTRDIYDYARAIGMGKHQADAEVMRARATYRHDRGVPGGLRWDESDDESVLGSETNDAAEYVTSIERGLQHGLVDPAGAWAEVARLNAKNLHSFPNPEPRGRKRKRDALDDRTINEGIVAVGQPVCDEISRASRKKRHKKQKQHQGHDGGQELVEMEPQPLKKQSRKQQEMARKSNLSTLGKPKKSINVKSEELSPNNATSKSVLTKQLDPKHAAKNHDDAKQDNLIRTEDEKPMRLGSAAMPEAANFTASKHGIPNDARDDSWDVRKKKKKKRKRRKAKTAGSSATSTTKHDSKTKTDPDDTKIKNEPSRDPPNVHDSQEIGEVSVGLGKDGVHRDIADGNVVLMPLSELTSNSTNKGKRARGERGRGKKAITSTPKSQSLDIDEGQRKSGIVEDGDSSKLSGGIEDHSDIFATISQITKTKCEVIIPLPSKTWWSHVMAKPEEKAESTCGDSSTSVLESTFSENTKDQTFTMSERSLDWDHSGPEFDDIKVEPKVTRSSPPKSTVTTPTKGVKTRSSSANLRTPKSERKLRDFCEEVTPTPAELVREPHEGALAIKKPRRAPVKSPFFSPPASAEKSKVKLEKQPRQAGGLVSCIPFPPLSNPSFGLLQEKLFNDPFRLLVGVTFLNRTMGKHAIPVFFSLMDRYPTPADILAADKEDIVSMTHHLGLQAQRAETYKKFAHFWIHDPPVKGKRYRVDHYPNPGDGMDIKASEVIDDSDPRTAWEIGHMTKGRYAIDSWRIFCRDILRGEASGWNGEGRSEDDESGFQPEWMRVQPRDKELIACLRWMWLKEGFAWDPVTGEKEVADRELMEAAIAGEIAWDDRGGMRIIEGDDDDDDDG